MKAVWYTKTGKAEDVLQIGEQDNPVPIAGEVLVRVRASGINPSDVKTRAGARGPLQFPTVIPHSDGSGEIIDVGKGVDKSKIGEKVWIWNAAFERAHRTCAELVTLPNLQAVKVNNNVSYEKNPPLKDKDIVVVNSSALNKFNTGLGAVTEPLSSLVTAITLFKIVD